MPSLIVPLDCRCSAVCQSQVGVCRCRKQLQLGGGWGVWGADWCLCMQSCGDAYRLHVCRWEQAAGVCTESLCVIHVCVCVCVWLCMCVVVGHRKLQERCFCNADVAALSTSSMHGGAVSTGAAFRADCWCATMQTECDQPSAFLFCAFACTLTCLAGRYYLELLLCSVAVDVVIV
jgi:hypothetical protein